jgi:ABC-type Mn2+/Zn2+ transport system permease subunit/Mn-dependent DtxR family transcriptional regulator
MNARCLRPALVVFLLLIPSLSHAARIGDLVETTVWEQAVRFFSFRDPALRLALVGCVLLGVSCGLLGSFLVVRRMALVGDTLSHAVLPGVAVGFLWNATKDPVAIFVGAVIAGLLGTFVVGWITRTTKLKEDAALGLVLAVFFAVGLVLMGIIQGMPTADKSGLDKMLFGQAAALSGSDVKLMGVTTGATILLLAVFYKEFLVSSFDPVFARGIGIPVRSLHHALMLLLAAAVVVALQAVGVVLVSAMLITPAATAYLLTDRMHRMLFLSAVLGIFSGLLGAFFSFLGTNLPTGPCMVLAASTVFAIAFLLAPKHGLLPRWWRRQSRSQRIARENTLKAVYHVLEGWNFRHEGVTLDELAKQRRTTLEEAQREVLVLARHGLATFDAPRRATQLTPEGSRQAAAVVRNHRLWELYLTSRANYRADHVHDDAEEMEHVLDEETVRMLERRLDFPVHDPHGKSIPRPQ